MRFIFYALAFVVLIPIVVIIILTPMLKERKISNGIKNQDTFSQIYLFKVNCTKDVFLQKISRANAHDLLEYTFDNDTMTIEFSRYGAKISYKIFVKETNNGCYITLNKDALVYDRSNIPYRINEFMIKKFDAELLPYEKYKDIVK